MKRTLVIFLVLCGAVSLLLKGTADRSIVRADDCKASATVSTSPAKDGKYLISSDVTSSDCMKLECDGFVHYLVSYHLLNGDKEQARDLNEYRINRGTQKDHIMLAYSVPDSGGVIDKVVVESVSCITTAP